jgi:hypothetical protein
MKRKFEIELNVPDNFDERYNPPYLLGPGCVITNGMLAWNVYADAKTPTPQWRQATASDEGKQARFRDCVDNLWKPGKLLHCHIAGRFRYVGLFTIDGSELPASYVFCEVQNES